MDPVHYTSDIEEEDIKGQKKSRDDISFEKSTQKAADHYVKLVKQSLLIDEYDKHERKAHMFHFLSMNAYSRHKKLMDDYMQYYGGKFMVKSKTQSCFKTDRDVIRENLQFVWEDDDEDNLDWNKKLAKRYYDKLFKEYCISDLVQYKLNRIALRWRVEKEVIGGKGQFICGDKRCNIKDDLKTWEVVFNYLENNIKKSALIKLRLCPICSLKLNYCHQRREIKKISKKVKKSKSPVSQPLLQQPQQISIKNEPSDINKTDWKLKMDKEKTKDEEIDEFLDDLFL